MENISEYPMKEIMDFLILSEGLKVKAYLDSANIPTIGIGSTFYADGTPVQMGDVITTEEAYLLGQTVAKKFAEQVKKALTIPVNKNQFTALVSFCYNIGPSAFRKCTLLKMVNASPNNPAIKRFWETTYIYAGGKKINGLMNRRKREAALYFKPVS